jgi:hypothetical protein
MGLYAKTKYDIPRGFRIIGLWMRWQGGSESRRELSSLWGRHLCWTDAEKDAVRRFYPCLTYVALQQMLPLRSWYAIKHCAKELGVVRPNRGEFSGEVPTAVLPEVPNTMAAYGFPLGHAGGPGPVATAPAPILLSPAGATKWNAVSVVASAPARR